MNAKFSSHVLKLPELLAALRASPKAPVRGGAPHSKEGGIYVLYENGLPLHVGRTRNLRKRLIGHTSRSHYSASFAFKQTRYQLGEVKASYKPEGSRAALVLDPIFGPAFLQQVERVRSMQVQFLAVTEPIDQYLLELYAALELGLALDEFDTH